MGVGRRFREDRIKTGVSLRRLAKDIGISASYLSDIENGNRRVNMEMSMRITAALFKYLGGPVHRRFDWCLIAAGLYTPERDCLARLWEKSFGNYPKNITLYRYRYEIYEALYGELDAHINGVDAPNMFEQVRACETFDVWESS